LKIQRTGNNFEFHTCHGRIGNNVFQGFVSLLEECREFLAAHPSEFVIMLLKVDDWSNAGRQNTKALGVLATLLSEYPVLSSPAMPALKTGRGKILLYNRINNNPKLGIPLHWPHDTAGAPAEGSESRHYEVWVQDRYNDFTVNPKRAKLHRLLKALTHKTPQNAVLNFASGTWFGIFKISVTPHFQKQQPGTIGWMLFDYPEAIITMIIASNF
jgi:hypothetical protein